MNERAAKFISYLFHPIWIPTWLILVLTLSDFQFFSFKKLFIVFFLAGLCTVTTVILPLAFTAILKNLGAVSSFQMPQTKERVLPYFFTGICLFFYAYLLGNTQASFLLGISPIFYSIGLTICATALITWTGFKISLHTTGWSGLLATVFLLSKSFYFNPLLLIIGLTIILGVVGAARLALNAHRPSEVYTGMINGILVQSAFIIFYYFA